MAAVANRTPALVDGWPPVVAAAADDSGWKQVRGDVFRRPPHILLYSALIGTGTQLILLASIVILAALAGSLYVDRGAGACAVDPGDGEPPVIHSCSHCGVCGRRARRPARALVSHADHHLQGITAAVPAYSVSLPILTFCGCLQ